MTSFEIGGKQITSEVAELQRLMRIQGRQKVDVVLSQGKKETIKDDTARRSRNNSIRSRRVFSSQTFRTTRDSRTASRPSSSAMVKTPRFRCRL
jgi:hypothetical protein